MWVGGQRHAPAALSPGKTRYPTGGPQDPVWTDAENLTPTEIRFPDRPARSESLHLMSYHGSFMTHCTHFISFVLYLAALPIARDVNLVPAEYETLMPDCGVRF